MSMLMQLLVGREIAKRAGVEDNAGQMRIGALAAVVPNPMLGLVVAKLASDREAPAPQRPDDGQKPPEQKPIEAGSTPPAKGRA